MRALLVLVIAAGLVAGGVLGLSALILPDPQPEAAGQANPDGTNPGSPGLPTGPGHHIEITGDRTATLTGESTEDFRFTLSGGLEDGFYIESMVYDGLNIFPDPDECALVHESTNLIHSQLRFSLDCEDISDVQGNNTINIRGWITQGTFGILPSGSERTGGTLTVSGDVEAEVDVPRMAWYVSSTGIPRATELALDQSRAVFGPDVGFDVSADGDITLSWLSVATTSYEAAPGDCSTETTVTDEIDEDTKRIEISIECPELTGEEGGQTVSVTGTILVDQTTIETDDVPPEG